MHNVAKEKKITKQKPTPKKPAGALFLCQFSQSWFLTKSGKKLLAEIALRKTLEMW